MRSIREKFKVIFTKASELLCLMTTLVLISFFPVNSYGETREIKIPWEPIPQATGYEIQIGNEIKRVDEAFINVELEPGYYKFRIRTVDPLGRLGPWSEVSELKIPGRALTDLSPENGHESEYRESPPKMEFSWESEDHAGPFRFFLKDSSGKVLVNKKTNRKNIRISNISKGSYTWGVLPEIKGVKNKELKSSHKFVISKKELNAAKLIEPIGSITAFNGDKVEFNWNSVEGASSYDLIIQPMKSDGRTPASKKRYILRNSKTTTRTVSLPIGDYQWHVVSHESKGTRGVASVAKSTEVRAGTGSSRHEIGAGVGIAMNEVSARDPFATSSSSDGDGGDATASSMLTSVVWSYAYRPSRDFQLRGWGNLLQLTLIGKDFNLINGGLSALKRFGLGGDWNVWIGAGPARRQHAVIALTSSDSTVDSAAATTLNARGSILLSTPIGTRWGLEVPLVYEHPVAGQGGTEVTSGGNYLRAGLQGRYALGKWKKNNTFSKSAIRLGAGIYQTEIQGKVTQGSFDVENSGIYLDLQYTLGF